MTLVYQLGSNGQRKPLNENKEDSQKSEIFKKTSLSLAWLKFEVIKKWKKNFSLSTKSILKPQSKIIIIINYKYSL